MPWLHFINVSALDQRDQRQGNVTWADLLDEDLLKGVPRHWLQFEPPPRLYHYVLGCLYVALLIFGFVANGTIMILYARCRSLRSPSNLLVLNLAISDFLMIAKTPIFIINSFHCGPALGHLGCQIYGFVGGLTGTSAIMTISAMALERFISIKYPFQGRPDYARSSCVLVFIWTYALLFASAPLVQFYSAYVPEGYLTSCSFDYLSKDTNSRLFIFAFFCGAFCIPMVVIVYSYVGIVLAVRASEMTFSGGGKSVKSKATKTNSSNGESGGGGSGSGSGAGANSSSSKAPSRLRLELKLAKMSACLISLWLVSWTPYAIIALIGVFGDQALLTPTATMFPALFAKLAAIVDPLIYGHSHPRFHEQAIKTFCTRSFNQRRSAARLATTLNATLDRSLSNRRERSRPLVNIGHGKTARDVSTDDGPTYADEAL